MESLNRGDAVRLTGGRIGLILSSRKAIDSPRPFVVLALFEPGAKSTGASELEVGPGSHSHRELPIEMDGVFRVDRPLTVDRSAITERIGAGTPKMLLRMEETIQETLLDYMRPK